MSTNAANLPIATKPHYPILDGLRGTAAILVVIFHLLEAYYPDYSVHPEHHGYLAVDFFFMLSGFVIGYAYDDRWGKMSTWDFFKLRLIRLHPLVILGAIVGAAGFWFDPFKNTMHPIGLLKLIGVMLIACTVLPTPDIRGKGGTHSLNGPFWSLLQEYIANILYAFWGRKMSNLVLTIVVIISAGLLAFVSIYHGNLAIGWGYHTFWVAIIRMLFPFSAGYLLFRTGKKLHLPYGYVICSLLLILFFFLPHFKYNGLYEAAVIIIGFPVILAIGAGSKIAGGWAKVSKFSGDISYPIYILHFPFIYIFTYWISIDKPAPGKIILVACGLLIFFVVLAYAALKLYDEPVRNWLKKKILVKK
jgi:peptidoglycan/LPS O-acetylase OafA/YrhL